MLEAEFFEKCLHNQQMILEVFSFGIGVIFAVIVSLTWRT